MAFCFCCRLFLFLLLVVVEGESGGGESDSQVVYVPSRRRVGLRRLLVFSVNGRAETYCHAFAAVQCVAFPARCPPALTKC